MDQRQVHYPGVGKDDAKHHRWAVICAAAPRCRLPLLLLQRRPGGSAQGMQAGFPAGRVAELPAGLRCSLWHPCPRQHADITQPAHAALAAGCEGVSAINTITSVMGINLDTLRPEPCGAQGAAPAPGSCALPQRVRRPVPPAWGPTAAQEAALLRCSRGRCWART